MDKANSDTGHKKYSVMPIDTDDFCGSQMPRIAMPAIVQSVKETKK
jgi:hypothetical protein